MTPEEEPRISIVDLYLPAMEGTELAELELEPCLGQFISNEPKEEFQPSPLILPSHVLESSSPRILPLTQQSLTYYGGGRKPQ